MGKNFITASIVEFLKSHCTAPTAFYFCTYQDASKDETLAVVRAWIVQLVEQRVEALKVVESMRKGHSVPSRVWKMFRCIVESLPTCYLAVDGLDECLDYGPCPKMRSPGRMKLFLRGLRSLAAGTRAKILIVSRNIGEIRSSVLSGEGNRPANYPITIQDTSQDILSVSTGIIDSMRMKDQVAKDEVLEKLSSRCEGMFLWLRLASDRLKPNMRRKQLTNALSSMPSGLDEAYERDLISIAKLSIEDRQWTIDILRWVLFTMRPLSVQELFHALAVRGQGTERVFEYADIPEPINQECVQPQILDMCRSLLEVRSLEKDEPIANQTYTSSISRRRSFC